MKNLWIFEDHGSKWNEKSEKRKWNNEINMSKWQFGKYPTAGVKRRVSLNALATCYWLCGVGNRFQTQGKASADQTHLQACSSSRTTTTIPENRYEQTSTKMNKSYIVGFVWTCTSTISSWFPLIPNMLNKSIKRSLHIQT